MPRGQTPLLPGNAYKPLIKKRSASGSECRTTGLNWRTGGSESRLQPGLTTRNNHNDKTAYIIIGSSNISKTAFLSNYELDSYFIVDKGSVEDERFLKWYHGFKFECDPIIELNEDEFDNFNWNTEQQAFGGRKVIQVSKNEISQRINKLTDVDTKKRLNMWLAHNPSEILSNLEIPALDDYIAFLYSDNGLAVFESFVPGNAFYSFRFDDFDRLLLQISKLTKTEMLVASDF